MEGSSLLVSKAAKAAKPWQRRTLEGSGGSGARFCVLRGRVVTFGLEGREGRETVAGA